MKKKTSNLSRQKSILVCYKLKISYISWKIGFFINEHAGVEWNFNRAVRDTTWNVLKTNEDKAKKITRKLFLSNRITSCQSGFRSLHSTLTALLEATNSWSVNIDNGFLNGVVFIDLKKAFDTIDHEIILRKLSYFGADQATIKWFQSYLSDRTQRCYVNGSLSTTSTVTCGVRQGSILGPMLFLSP